MQTVPYERSALAVWWDGLPPEERAQFQIFLMKATVVLALTVARRLARSNRTFGEWLGDFVISAKTVF